MSRNQFIDEWKKEFGARCFYITLPDAMKLLSMSRTTLLRKVDEGLLNISTMKDGSMRISRSDIMTYASLEP